MSTSRPGRGGGGASKEALLVAAHPLEALTDDHEGKEGTTEESVVMSLLGAQKKGQVY